MPYTRKNRKTRNKSKKQKSKRVFKKKILLVVTDIS